MITQSEHREQWTVTIDREQGDEWPDMKIGYTRKRTMRPARIEFTLHRGDDRPRVHVTGRNYLKNGEIGNLVLSESWADKIPWVMALVREARERLQLGPDVTGVQW